MSKSGISSSLIKKRRKILIKKIGVVFIFALFFISIFVLFLTIDKIKIKEVDVVGNTSVNSDEILDFVQKELDKKYFWIIPTNNIFLLRRSQIYKEVFKNFKKIKDIDLDMFGFSNLTIIVSERIAESFWCTEEDLHSECYFMDGSGFVFAKAPDFTNNIYIKYYGLIEKEDPIGKNYFSSNKFVDIKNFLSEIKRIGLMPESFLAINEHQYEIILFNNAKVCLDDKDDLSKNILKINTLIENDYIKTDIDFVSKINHIDLRYGNKVHYDFK